MPASRGSSRPRDWTWVSCIAGRSITIWATKEPKCCIQDWGKNIQNCFLDITAQVSCVFVFLLPEAGCSELECHVINIPLETGSSDTLQFWLSLSHRSNLQVQGLWLRARSAEPAKHRCRAPLVNSEGGWPSKTSEDVTPALTFSLNREQSYPRFMNIISCLKRRRSPWSPGLFLYAQRGLLQGWSQPQGSLLPRDERPVKVRDSVRSMAH